MDVVLAGTLKVSGGLAVREASVLSIYIDKGDSHHRGSQRFPEELPGVSRGLLKPKGKTKNAAGGSSNIESKAGV